MLYCSLSLREAVVQRNSTKFSHPKKILRTMVLKQFDPVSLFLLLLM